MNPHVSFSAALLLAAATAQAVTFSFVPGAGTTAAASGTANWADGASWVNLSNSSVGAIPGAADTAGSATGGTTIVDSAVPTINELRFANAVSGTTVATVNGVVIKSTAEATLDIHANGALTILSTNGTSNGDAWFGRAQPSGGHLIISGGSLTTGVAAGFSIANDSTANVIIGDIAGTASGSTGAANSTLDISGGTLTSGNNLIVGNGFAAVSGNPYFATGTATQSSGTVNVAGAVQIGANGNGSYVISGGSLSQLGTNPDGDSHGRDAFFVGRNGNGTGNAGATGTFTQSGTAAVSIANGLYIANNANTTGTYTVSGGTLTIAGEIKVGASTNSTGSTTVNVPTNNVGRFNIVGNSTPTITANRLTADTANSTLGFTPASDAGTSLLNLTAGNSLDGSANLSSSTKLDIDPAAGFTPNANTVFELIRATAFNATPTIVGDGDAFDGYKVGFIDRGTTRSLVVAPFAVSSWTGATDNNWSSANWAGSVPSAARDVANFGPSAPVSAHQVVLDTNETVGVINFTDSGNSYTISGAATLTLDNGSNAAIISLSTGLHTIATPITLNTDLILNTDGDSSAQITAALNANGKNLSKTGSQSGTLKAINNGGGLSISAGTLALGVQPTANSASSVSKVTSLTIAPGANGGKLDLGDNALVIDYTGPVGTQVATIREALRTGQIVNSGTALKVGYNDNGARSAALTSVAGLGIDTSSIVLVQTRGGDANLDLTVNFDDLVVLAQNYNQLSDKTWATGDFDYSGGVNFDDLVILAQNYNQSASLSQIQSLGAGFAADFALARSLVPEPTSMLVIAAATAAVTSRRRR